MRFNVASRVRGFSGLLGVAVGRMFVPYKRTRSLAGVSGIVVVPIIGMHTGQVRFTLEGRSFDMVAESTDHEDLRLNTRVIVTDVYGPTVFVERPPRGNR